MTAFGKGKEDRQKFPATKSDGRSEVAAAVAAPPKDDETDRAGAWDEVRFCKYLPFYQHAIIAAASSDPKGLGRLKEADILSGKIFTDSNLPAATRISAEQEEFFLHKVMKHLGESELCFRQGEYVVFPDCWPQDLPEVPYQLPMSIGYGFAGDCRKAYVTLIADLASGKSFIFYQLWRDAATFITLAKSGRILIKLEFIACNQGRLMIHFDIGVGLEAKLAFVNHIYRYLDENNNYFMLQWNYFCPKCGTLKLDNATLIRKINRLGESARVHCDECDETFALWGALEEGFADPALRARVEQLRAMTGVQYLPTDTIGKGKLLFFDVATRITRAGQNCLIVHQEDDNGIDAHLEFKNADGAVTGRRIYLQLKAGFAPLYFRQEDGQYVFYISKQKWVNSWLTHQDQVMLVIGTFRPRQEWQDSPFATVQWMEISSVLRQNPAAKHIVFKGEDMTEASILRWRDIKLNESSRID